jgi:ubiquinone/menaquinone biosynthesis C-methylase UbiE
MILTTSSRRLTSLTLAITLLVPAAAVAARQSGTITTDRIVAALDVREGATVCEMGAGDGGLSLAAAKIVGPNGRVYASELGDDRLKGLREKVGGDARVTAIAGDAMKTNFPDAACDAIFMRNVYHHFENPAAMNASIAAALKPGGRLVIVDFTPPPGSEAACPADRGKDGMHGVTPPSLTRELTAAGFRPAMPDVIAQRAFMVVMTR